MVKMEDCSQATLIGTFIEKLWVHKSYKP
jgi:hypothetical protein